MDTWLQPDTDDPELKRQARVLVRTVVLFALVGVTASVLTALVSGHPEQIAAGAGSLLTISAITVVLVRKGHLLAAAHVFTGAMWAAGVAQTLTLGGITRPGVMGPALALMLAGLLLPKRATFVYAVLTLALAIGVAVTDERWQPLGEPRSTLEVTAIVASGFALIAVLAYIVTGSLREALRSSQASRQELRQLIDASPDAIVALDLQGRLLECNPATGRMLGTRCDQVLGKPFHEVADVDSALLPTPEELRTKGAMLFELEPKRADGSRFPVENHATILRRAGGEVIQLIVRDISARREAESAKEMLALKDLEARRLEAMGRLAGGIAHDFNNIITAILSYCDLLRDDRLPADAMQKIEAINRSAERAGQLTGQLLAFSRRQVLEPQVLDLNAAVEGLQDMLERLVPENISLKLALWPEAGRLKADPAQLEQVIVNLVANARDAMPDGGALTIETQSVELDEVYASHHQGVAPGHYALLAVTDTGTGMDEETVSRAFEPFFTTKDMGRGTGLGLATCHGIVAQSGGHIFIYSELERGTTFKVYLPIVDAPLTVTPGAMAVTAKTKFSETLMLVDDDELVRNSTARALERGGYTVLAADSGDEALQIASAHPTHIDLLITDVVMPKDSGPELAIKLRAVRPEIEVLYISGYTENAIVHGGALDDGLFFLAKPFTPTLLRSKVREILDRPQ